MRYVVLGTVLMEPVLLAIRRLAQQSASFERFGGGERLGETGGGQDPRDG
jgi:hypothetical protein